MKISKGHKFPQVHPYTLIIAYVYIPSTQCQPRAIENRLDYTFQNIFHSKNLTLGLIFDWNTLLQSYVQTNTNTREIQYRHYFF